MKDIKTQALELYVMWAYGVDDEIKQSDFLAFCFDHDIDDDEIVKTCTDEIAEKIIYKK